MTEAEKRSFGRFVMLIFLPGCRSGGREPAAICRDQRTIETRWCRERRILAGLSSIKTPVIGCCAIVADPLAGVLIRCDCYSMRSRNTERYLRGDRIG
jgi:hypothetical protein